MEGLYRQPEEADRLNYVKLLLVAKFAGTGQPALQQQDPDDLTWSAGISSPKIVSFTRNGVGDYTLVLDSKMAMPLGVEVVSWQTTTGLPTAPLCNVKAATVPLAPTDTLNLIFTTVGGGSATDPGNGEVLAAFIRFCQVTGA